MANHHKPTKEELKRGMDASLEKLKNLPPEETPPVEDPPTPPAPPTPPTPPAGDPPTPPAGDPPVPPPTPPTPPAPPTPPENETPEQKIARLEKEKEDAKAEAEEAKKKFSNSSREAQVLGFKEKELAKAQEEADKLPEPTDEEMKALYPNWDEIDPLTRDLAKDRVLNKKKQEVITAAREKFKNVQEWTEKVESFVSDPAVLVAHPELEGKAEEFKAFASKPTRRGVDFEDLVLAFQGEQAKTKLPPKSGQMFEQGSGGPSTPPVVKDDKLSVAEGAALRKTDYKKYVELLKAGKIRTT